MQRTKDDIYALIKKGERLHAECKEAFGGMPDTLWESYSSFANTDGGVIVLGVKERADHSLVVQGVKDADALIKCFWDTANNVEKVSLNVVDRRGAYAVDCDGKTVVVIEVPRAERHDRPVFIGHDVFEGSYRRNGEGDYKMKRESVATMIRDKCIVTADACVLEERYDPDRTVVRVAVESSSVKLGQRVARRICFLLGFPEPHIEQCEALPSEGRNA